MIMNHKGERLYGDEALQEEARRAKARIDKKTKAYEEKREMMFKADARNNFVANGGSPDEFDKQWPTIRKALIQDMAKPGGGTGVNRPSNLFRVKL